MSSGFNIMLALISFYFAWGRDNPSAKEYLLNAARTPRAGTSK